MELQAMVVSTTALPVYLLTCLPVYLLTCLPVHLSICLPAHLSPCHVWVRVFYVGTDNSHDRIRDPFPICTLFKEVKILSKLQRKKVNVC